MTFLRLISGCLLAALVLAIAPRTAFSETIGISVPLSGDFSELGKKFSLGAKLAMEKHGQNHRLFVADDGCNPDLALLAAEDLLSQSVGIAGGFLCNDAAITVATELSEREIPVLVGGARSPRLIKDREREDWNLWRFAPGDDYPVEAAAQAIEQLWRTTPFAVVDDGTIYGRSFTDQLRLKLDARGLKAQFFDSFRAAQSTQAGLLRRLERSGAVAAFIASATTEDLLTIARNKTELGINLEIMTTEALMVLPFLPSRGDIAPGLKVVGWPLPRDEFLDRLLQDRGIVPNHLIYQGYATIEIATAAVGRGYGETAKNLETGSFETVLGTIRFNADGSSGFNPYRLLEWDGQEFREPAAEQVLQ